MKISRWAVVFSLCAWSAVAPGEPVVLELAGAILSFKEYDLRTGEQLPRHQQEFAPAFEGARTVIGSISWETTLPDTDFEANVGAYTSGTFSISILEVGLSASRSGSAVEFHTYDDTPYPLPRDDQLIVEAEGVDSFTSQGGLRDPVSFSIWLYGDSPMLASDDLPTDPLEWVEANLRFRFVASDGADREVMLLVQRGVVPSSEPGGCPPPPITGPPPTITSLDHAVQVVGQPIQIAGTGFDATPANNTVFFGAVRADVISASATSLSATVPAGATFGPVSVLVGSLTAFSPAQFLPTFAAAAPAIDAATLAEKVDFPTGTAPAGLAVGDLDGDGQPDLAVVDHGSDTMSLLRNTSATGVIDQTSFAPRVDFNTGSEPWDVAIGDLNGDGNPDLVVTHRSAGKVSVFRNTSTPGSIDASSFAPQVDFTAGAGPVGVVLGDMDGDGKADIVTANQFSDNVSVFRNTSVPGEIDACSFADNVDFAAGDEPVRVAIADIDGDGRPDLAVANEQARTVSLFRNTSTPGRIDASSLAPKVDVSTRTGDYGSASSVAMGDLDGDGQPEPVVALSTASRIAVFRNTSVPGRIDASSFSGRVDYSPPFDPRSVAIGDVDGDGKADVAAAEFSGSRLSVFRNTSGSGTMASVSLATPVRFPTGDNPRDVVIGDLDGDGRPELAVSNYNSHSVSVFKSQTTVDTTVSVHGNCVGIVVDSIVCLGVDAEGHPEFAVRLSFANPSGAGSMTLGSREGDLIPATPFDLPAGTSIRDFRFVDRPPSGNSMTLHGTFRSGDFVCADTLAVELPSCSARAEAPSVQVSDASAAPGATGVEVHIEVDEATGIAGGDLTLTYDADALTATGVRGTSLLDAAGMTLVANLRTPGQVRVSFAGATGIPAGGGPLMVVSFDVKAGAQAGTYDLALTRADLRDGSAQFMELSAVSHGQVTVEPRLSAGPISIDFDLAEGDQGRSTQGGVAAGRRYTVQFHAVNAPPINGWSARIEFDPLQVRYVSGSFVLSGFVVGMLSLVEEKPAYVSVGGALLGGGAQGAGPGLLGSATFEVLAGFAGETALTIRQMSWKHVGSGEEILTVQVVGTLSAADGLAGDFNGDGAVNFSDFFLFADAFGGSDPAYDLTGDGAVNFSDFFLFADAFGTEGRAKLMALAREYLGLLAAARLEQNYPNPFNSSTTIRYWLPQPESVRLDVYNLSGQWVRCLAQGRQPAGAHAVEWDGTDEGGASSATGIYLARLQAGPTTHVNRMLLVK